MTGTFFPTPQLITRPYKQTVFSGTCVERQISGGDVSQEGLHVDFVEIRLRGITNEMVNPLSPLIYLTSREKNGGKLRFVTSIYHRLAGLK